MHARERHGPRGSGDLLADFVVGAIGPSKVAVTLVFNTTPVALSMGVTLSTVGGMVSGVEKLQTKSAARLLPAASVTAVVRVTI